MESAAIEILLEVFRYLPFPDYLRAMRVCRHWRDVAHNTAVIHEYWRCHNRLSYALYHDYGYVYRLTPLAPPVSAPVYPTTDMILMLKMEHYAERHVCDLLAVLAPKHKVLKREQTVRYSPAIRQMVSEWLAIAPHVAFLILEHTMDYVSAVQAPALSPVPSILMDMVHQAQRFNVDIWALLWGYLPVTQHLAERYGSPVRSWTNLSALQWFMVGIALGEEYNTQSAEKNLAMLRWLVEEDHRTYLTTPFKPPTDTYHDEESEERWPDSVLCEESDAWLMDVMRYNPVRFALLVERCPFAIFTYLYDKEPEAFVCDGLQETRLVIEKAMSVYESWPKILYAIRHNPALLNNKLATSCLVYITREQQSAQSRLDSELLSITDAHVELMHLLIQTSSMGGAWASAIVHDFYRLYNNYFFAITMALLKHAQTDDECRELLYSPCAQRPGKRRRPDGKEHPPIFWIASTYLANPAPLGRSCLFALPGLCAFLTTRAGAKQVPYYRLIGKQVPVQRRAHAFKARDAKSERASHELRAFISAHTPGPSSS